MGHLEKVCRQKDKNKTSGNNFVADDQSMDEENEDFVYMLNLDTDVGKVDSKNNMPHMVNIMIENVNISMEIDSGAGRSILPHEFYNKYLLHCDLIKTDIKLKFYNGETVLPVQKIHLNIKNKNKTIKHDMLVVRRTKTVNGSRPDAIIRILYSRS